MRTEQRAQAPDPYFIQRERLELAAHLEVRRLGKRDLVAERYRHRTADLGLTTPNARRDVVMAVVHLRDRNGGEHIFRDGEAIRRPGALRGDLALLDHRHEWVSDLREPFDVVSVFIPLTGFGEAGDERIDGFDCPIEQSRADPTMFHLALSLLPGLERPQEANALFVDRVFDAMRLHLASRYGGTTRPGGRPEAALAPWQERRAKAILLDDLEGDHGLTELAAACGLSVSHFARAFKATTGMPPHRWLLARRVERAMNLLERTSEPLGQIALACGFADQSHLTRVFGRRVGVSPAAWRRERRH